MNGLIWNAYWYLKLETYIDITQDYIKLLKTWDFFPKIKHCLLIFIILSPTPCTEERSFITLLRVKI